MLVAQSWNNNWDYWNYFDGDVDDHRIMFDGPSKIIHIVQGVTELDATIHLYSHWKQWVKIVDNARWLPALSTVGGEPIPGGNVGATFFLINGWRIKPWQGDYRLNVQGNLYTAEGDNPFIPVSGVSISQVVSDLNTNQVIETEKVVEKIIEATLPTYIQELLALTYEEARKARQMATNNVTVMNDGKYVEIYDDDGITVLHRFDVADDRLSRIAL